MEAEVQKQILAEYNFVEERSSVDCPAFTCSVEKVYDFLQVLRDRYSFMQLSDVTAIDWDRESPRFTVVWHLYNLESHSHVRVAANLLSDSKPSCPSVVSLWDGANWHERETYDMFGIEFENHPNLTRILMWEDYPHHPLRKDFPLAGKEVELPAADVRERVDTKVKAAPMMGGPFHAGSGSTIKEMEPRAKDESWSEENEKPEKV